MVQIACKNKQNAVDALKITSFSNLFDLNYKIECIL